jgi:DNA-binding winged helix-turn-helix (wHTH) protein/Tfp pilus assembly protein PilF
MQSKTIRFAPFEVNLEERELRKSGVRIPLQHKPFRILELLLRQPGALVSRQELAKELWPGLHVNFEHSLNSAVNTLRQALEDSSRECRYIETRSGLGYRFIAPVEEVSDGRHAAPPRKGRSGAHHDYLRGRFFLNKMTNEGIQRAIGCFQSALNDEPDFALANAGLADSYCRLALSGAASVSDVSAAARDFASAALRMEPALPEAHVSMGQVRMIFDWDWRRASDSWSRASDLNPSLTEAHRGRALLFAARNRHDDALEEICRAQELEPLSLPIGFEQAWLLFLAGRFAEAADQSWRVLTLEPAFAPAQIVLGLAYHQLGSLDEAITELENACTCSDRDAVAVAALGYVYATAGSGEKARGLLAELTAQAQRRHVAACSLALVHMGLAQRHLALEALKTACALREPQLLWVNADPRLTTLHSEPEFLALQHHLGFD